MILKVKKAFEFGGRKYIPGQLVKMGTKDYKRYQDKLDTEFKYTKEIVTKRTK